MNLKRILAKNTKVNAEQLEESIKLSRKLAKNGVTTRRGYNLPSPFENRLVKAGGLDLEPTVREN